MNDETKMILCVIGSMLLGFLWLKAVLDELFKPKQK